jgi:hypothetical protein
MMARRNTGTDINMGGADMDNQKNPLSLIINAAKKSFGKD